MNELERFKRAAALAALEHVASGTTIGLGTGSTAAYVIAELGRRLAAGDLRDVRAVPTSLATQRAAVAARIPLVELGADGVDVAIDGVDEVTDALEVIKGFGGALTREKIVAAAARTFVVAGDHTKHVERLGARARVPVEVLPFGLRRTMARLAEVAGPPTLRSVDGAPFVSDNGNLVVDCRVEAGFDAPAVATAVEGLPGVVAHGLFLGVAHVGHLTGPGGGRTLRRAAVAGVDA